MPENDEWKAVLKHFRRKDLDSVLEYRGLEIGATNRDELIGAMTRESPDLCESICEPYIKLRGVSAQGIIQEIFLLENELGPIVANCRTKPQIVTKLFLADRLDVIDRVADYARYTKKRQVSPMAFSGRIREDVIQTTLRETVEGIIRDLNPSRPKALVFQDATYSPNDRVVRIAVSREIGRRHVLQRPERTTSPEMIEHDDYPLRPHVIEVDLSLRRVRTTFGRHDRDGLGVTHSILGGFVDLEERLNEPRFRSNVLDSDTVEETSKAIDDSLSEHSEGSPVHQTLVSLKEAKKVILAIRGLNIVGDLRKLEVHASDVDQVVRILGIESSLLEGARDVNYEIELPDSRRIRVYSHSMTFVGEFSKNERNALEEVFLK